MKKLNKMPRSSYDDGKVLAYDAETSWIAVSSDYYPCVAPHGDSVTCVTYECVYDPFGCQNCSIGSYDTECWGGCPDGEDD